MNDLLPLSERAGIELYFLFIHNFGGSTVKKLLRFVLGNFIGALLCILLPGFAVAKEMPQFEGSADDPSACDADPANIVQNCGFETGSFASWTQSGDLGFTDVMGGPVAHTGNFGARLGPVGALGFLTQNLPTTAGGRYFIVFWLRNSGTPSEFGVYWDGNLYWRWPNTADFDYTRIAIGPVTASTSSTPLTFAFQNVPDFYYLDDIDVYPAGGGGGGCTQIMQPGMMGYLTSTGRCDIGTTLFQDTTTCRNSDGSVAATFNPAINVRHAGVPGGGWATWSAPPESESSTPFVGYTNGSSTELVTFTNSASIAGLEAEPNPFQVFTMTAVFQDSSGTEVARVVRDVDGSAGARLFAVSCSSPVIAKISVSMSVDFAIGQIRSDHITGATLGLTDVDPQPVPPNATSNSQ